MQQFYLKGTQLTQLQEDYLLLQRNVESISETIKSKSAQLPDLKKDFDIANNRYEEARATLNQKERLAQLKKDYLWSKVAEKRKVSLAPVVFFSSISKFIYHIIVGSRASSANHHSGGV